MDRRKTAWLASAVGALGLIAAGVVFGPGLYQRFFTKVTPLGTVTRLEDAGTAGAPAGHRFWAVHFKSKPRAGEAEGKTKVFSESSIDLARPSFPTFGPDLGRKRDPMREAYILDDTGEKHAAIQANGKLLTQPSAGNPDSVKLHFRLEKLIFSLPQERQPRFLQVSDTPAVRLPGAT